MHEYRRISALLIVAAVSVGWCACAEADTSPPDRSITNLIDQAARLAKKEPGVYRRVGLAEMLRAAGRRADSLRELTEAAGTKDTAEAHARLRDLICWRMMPVPRAQLAAFRRAVAAAETQGSAGAWVGVWKLYLASMSQDRAAVLAAAQALPAAAPKRFAGAFAEQAHFDLLVELGVSRTAAGLAVVSHRAFEPLYALRDLDRALTREARSLRDSGRAGDAEAVQAARDALRGAYLSASRHLVERLFALRLAGREKQRDELLARAGRLAWLTDPKALAEALKRLDEDQAWTLMVKPMLAGDLTLIGSPPEWGRAKDGATAALSVRSARKSMAAGITSYEGSVQIRLGHLSIHCDRASLISGPDQADVMLAGSGRVTIRGVPGKGTITADRFTFNSALGSFSLSGDVRIARRGGTLRAQEMTLKLRACTITALGEVRDRKSLLADFAAAETIDRKLALLPAITKVHADAELPDEARYLLGLDLLREHLTWHTPPLRRREDRGALRELRRSPQHWDENEWRWQNAHTGEPWMLAGLRDAERGELRRAEAALREASQRELKAVPFYWRLKEPDHPDVARAQKLLEGVKGAELAREARRWLAEIRRNNTVLTFDVPGGYPQGRGGPLVMDARNAEHVSFQLYRARSARDLVGVADRIGGDFIYRDHDLWEAERLRAPGLIRMAHGLEGLATRRLRSLRARPAVPVFTRADLVGQWDVRVADLEPAPIDRWLERRRDREWDGGWDGEPEAWHFDDACRRHEARLRKSYRSDLAVTSAWVCDRLVWIPAGLLAKAGGYVLVAEANGRKAYAPILVEPLSLTMRRCRDGVFVLVSDAEGNEPIRGAEIHGHDMVGTAVTDAQGAAFARIFAAGDRALIAEKDGRYAIGGFGRVFEGLYVSRGELQREDRVVRRLRQVRRFSAAGRPGQVYSGGHVVAAYTDRPTYRPGQQVRFKLIVRRLPRAGHQPDANASGRHDKPNASRRHYERREFRAEDFEIGSNLELPPTGAPIRYDVINPRKRVVAEGALRLNDYGTAAGEIKLLTEAATGTYSLRVNIDGRTRVVPDVFAVKYYRRPNFLLEVAGVPDKIVQPGPLPLSLAGRYYFGKPLAGGRVEARLVRLAGCTRPTPLSEADATLDEQGRAELSLPIPQDLAAGQYAVLCTLTDPTGRIVSKSIPCRVESFAPGAGALARSGLADLPRFVPWGKPLAIKTGAAEVVARPRPRWEGQKAPPADVVRFKARAGTAAVKLPGYGWYRLSAGSDHTDVFVYGGTSPPQEIRGRLERAARDKAKPKQPTGPQWVDLTRYTGEEPREYDPSAFDKDRDRWDSRWDSPRLRLPALFERHHAQVGGKLRVLVYVPFDRARLLFTLEGWTVVDYLAVRLRQNEKCHYHVIEIPIKERHRPNFYLRGRILWGQPEPAGELAAAARELVAQEADKLQRLAEEVDDGSEDPRWCRVDVLAPSAPAGGEKLKVGVDTDRGEYRPGRDVNVVMRVTDFDGKARQAEVSLGAVDESVYSFGEDSVAFLAEAFSDPRPSRRYLPKTWRSFCGAKWSAKQTAQRRAMAQQLHQLARAQDRLAQRAQVTETLQDLAQIAAWRRDRLAMPRAPGLSAFGEMPATSLSWARLRRDFRETAAWQPQLRTNAEGIVRTSFKLPDSLTAYRLTAVALTKKTEIGTGRAKLRVKLPISVQVFLPRFAVETDRLLAVALIHNNTQRPRTAQVAWEVSGAAVGGRAGRAESWETRPAAGGTTVVGRVSVPAGGTARVGLWITAEAPGTAKIAFRAGAGEDVDAEQRLLPIHPLGRYREVAMTGSFVGRKEIKLPAGFVARDLTVTLTRSRAAEALDGLGYLVEYPYGCVEQTMSRFLPAVTVKHAVRQVAAALPPDVERKLPDVLAKGLARLYNFQQADGGWGWWRKDKSAPWTTVYVVYGLARCKLTGTEVDPDVLRRGCERIKKLLAAHRSALGREAQARGSGDVLAAELEGRAWLALALAGEADRDLLAGRAREALQAAASPEARCTFALACREAALNEAAERCWAAIRGWSPQAIQNIAMKLSAQVAFGAPLAECRASVAKLLSRRGGHRWGSTLATSWAVVALSDMLQYARNGTSPKAVKIDVAGRTVLDAKDPAELSKLVYRARAAGALLAAKDAPAVRLRVEGAEPVSFALTAAGTQRLDKVEPIGTDVKIRRRYTTLDGRPIDRPLDAGEVFAARLTVELARPQEYFIIEDRRPAGCEFAEDRIFGQDAASAAHAEFRDDRVCVFHTSLSAGRHEIVYYLRAETAGTSHVLPGRAFPMYDEKTRGETGAARVEVKQ